MSNNPLKFVDPTGLDYIYLNDNNGANWQGHAAVIVGNDDIGYTYYSKDGKHPEDPTSRTARGNHRVVIKRGELGDFLKSEEIAGRYEKIIRIETTQDQDEAMKKIAEEDWDTEYDFSTNNCGDLAKNVGIAGGLLNKWDGTVYGVTRPNTLKKRVQEAAFISSLKHTLRRFWDKVTGHQDSLPDTSNNDNPQPSKESDSDDRKTNDSDKKQKDTSNKSQESESGSIICTELYRQGLMAEEIYRADELFGRMVETNFPLVKEGYLIIARPIVNAMRKSASFTVMVNKFAKPWSRQMAYMIGASDEQNLAGAVIMILGVPLCFVIGFLYKYAILLEIMILIFLFRRTAKGIVWNLHGIK